MKRQPRVYQVAVTGHEKVLLAFYRAASLQHQRDVDGLLAAAWRVPEVAERFRHESRMLQVGELTVDHIEPFLEASQDIVGVERRVA